MFSTFGSAPSIFTVCSAPFSRQPCKTSLNNLLNSSRVNRLFYCTVRILCSTSSIIDFRIFHNCFSNVARVPEEAGRLITLIFSSFPPTSFQFVTFPVKISCTCCTVKLSTFTSLFTTSANAIPATLLSTNSFALSASFILSADGTSELPIGLHQKLLG